MASKRTPRTPKKARARKSKPDWGPAWLEAFEAVGTVVQACRRTDVGRRTVYDRRERDEEFAAAWSEIEEELVERMEREAYRRAVEGVERQTYTKDGELIREEQVYSDTLLIFLLKARRPKTYRDNVRHEHSGPEGGPISHEVNAADEKVRKHLSAALRASAEAERGAD